MEKGTSNGTITDLDGNFKLQVAKGATLVVSFVGFIPQELTAAGGMKITLKEDALNLQEVVVTGYTTQRKADLTGSVAVVQTKDLKTSADSDPMRALQGKVAGMTISTDGSPSGTGTVRIRGIGSFNSSQDPLFVIDGVPTNYEFMHQLTYHPSFLKGNYNTGFWEENHKTIEQWLEEGMGDNDH